MLLQQTIFEWYVNNRNLFLAVWCRGKSKIKWLADSVSGEVMFPGSETAVFTKHIAEGELWSL